MKIIILGAGITGVTAAYALASRGHEVEVIESEKAPAMQCSHANGAQLSYSHAEPWANPSVLPKAIKWMFKADAPLVMRFRPDMHMLRWTAAFLGNCTTERAHENCKKMLRLGLYSREKMHQIIAETDIKFSHLQKGIMHVFTCEKDFNAAAKQSEFQAELGCVEQVLSTAEMLKMEPALAGSDKNLIGGIYADIDESGDARAFTTKLTQICKEKYGVKFHYGTHVGWLKPGDGNDSDQITTIETSKGHFEADAYVMSLGAHSRCQLKRIGINTPIYPMKGYSITIPTWDGAPHASITDDEKKIVISRIGNKLRAAGTAEFAGYNQRIREKRIEPLLRCVKSLFPSAPDDSISNAEKWSCLRPQTPDGPPIIGKTKYKNLYLNTGHGTLGWTHGAATAYAVADIIEGKQPEIEVSDLGVDRYKR